MGRAFEVRKASMMKTSIAKAKVYTKHSRAIYLAAKAGVPDPDNNTTLRREVDKAKKNQVPADTIKRAIDKAKNNSGEDFVPMRYEGFGPGQVTVIVDCLSDNANRTVSEVKNCFTKSNSKMGVSGSVAHMYDELAVAAFAGDYDEEELLDNLLEHDVEPEDIEFEDGMVTVYAAKDQFNNLMTALEDSYPEISFEMSEITMLPQFQTEITSEDEQKDFDKLMDMLNECDDVQEVYHNVK